MYMFFYSDIRISEFQILKVKYLTVVVLYLQDLWVRFDVIVIVVMVVVVALVAVVVPLCVADGNVTVAVVAFVPLLDLETHL